MRRLIIPFLRELAPIVCYRKPIKQLMRVPFYRPKHAEHFP